MAQLLLAAQRGDEGARTRLIDLATTTRAAASTLDLLLAFEVQKAERAGGLPELTAEETRVVAAVVRSVGGWR